MLKMLLAKLRERLDKVMVSCDDSNVSSWKTIERCGSVLRDKPTVEGTIIRRYWIAIPNARR